MSKIKPKIREKIAGIIQQYLVDWILPRREGLTRQCENVGILHLILLKHGFKTNIVLGTNTMTFHTKTISKNDGVIQETTMAKRKCVFDNMAWLEYKGNVIDINTFYNDERDTYIIKPIILGAEQPLPKKIVDGCIVMKNTNLYKKNKKMLSRKNLAAEVPFFKSNKLLRTQVRYIYAVEIPINKMLREYF